MDSETVAAPPQAVQYGADPGQKGLKSNTKGYAQDYNYTPPFHGIELPIVIGIGGMILGIVLMAIAWVKYPTFFRRRIESAPPDALDPGAKFHAKTVVPESSVP